MEVTVIGKMDNTLDHTFESANRVYDSDGLAPTINTCGGGGLQPKIIVAMRGRNPDNPSDRTTGAPTEQRLEPDSQGTITANGNISSTNCGTFGVVERYGQYRIRKLTPLECWRLMGFSDEDFRKAEGVNSNHQLYKQAGNSIVKNVLMEIFRQIT